MDTITKIIKELYKLFPNLFWDYIKELHWDIEFYKQRAQEAADYNDNLLRLLNERENRLIKEKSKNAELASRINILKTSLNRYKRKNKAPNE